MSPRGLPTWPGPPAHVPHPKPITSVVLLDFFLLYQHICGPRFPAVRAISSTHALWLPLFDV